MKKLSILFILLFLSACSASSDKTESLTINYWANDADPEFISNEKSGTIKMFEDSIMEGKLLEKGKVIKTQPFVSLSFLTVEGRERSFHLWINSSGEGFAQSLRPEESRTYKLDKKMIEQLTTYFKSEKKIEIPNGEIQFE